MSSEDLPVCLLLVPALLEAETKEMTQLLRVYVVLSKDPSSGPQTTWRVTAAPET